MKSVEDYFVEKDVKAHRELAAQQLKVIAKRCRRWVPDVNKTVVIWDGDLIFVMVNGRPGWSKRNPIDKFNYDIGLRIAINRACRRVVVLDGKSSRAPLTRKSRRAKTRA